LRDKKTRFRLGKIFAHHCGGYIQFHSYRSVTYRNRYRVTVSAFVFRKKGVSSIISDLETNGFALISFKFKGKVVEFVVQKNKGDFYASS